MMSIRVRLDDIENNFLKIKPVPMPITESNLISLPDHLRKTYMIVMSKGECDAVHVSKLTGRCRAVESNYLNQLSRMGWLDKRRISKVVHFSPSQTLSASLQNVKTPPELISPPNI